MPATNFKVMFLPAWARMEEPDIVHDEERPHVVPVTLEAVDFVEWYSKHSKAGSIIFGGFLDPLSTLQTEGGPIKAFRFKSLELHQQAAALERAESRFRQWQRQKQGESPRDRPKARNTE